MKVTIDREECTECAICWDICPEFFEQSDEDDLSQVVEKFRTNGQIDQGNAPEELSDAVHEAAAGCPVEIIEVE